MEVGNRWQQSEGLAAQTGMSAGYETSSPHSHINLVISSSNEGPPPKDTTCFPKGTTSWEPETTGDISQSNHSICVVLKSPKSLSPHKTWRGKNFKQALEKFEEGGNVLFDL